MKTTPAQEGWFGRTHRTFRSLAGSSGGYLDRGIVRTSFSNAEHYQSNADSRGSLSTAISTANAVRKRSPAPTATAIPAEAGACPLTRPAACRRSDPPDHRQRVRCKAQCRLSDCCSPSTAAVVGAGWVLSISCTCAKVTPESEQTVSRASELEVWR